MRTIYYEIEAQVHRQKSNKCIDNKFERLCVRDLRFHHSNSVGYIFGDAFNCHD